MSHITAVLDSEQTRINGILTSTTAVPSAYHQAVLNKSLDVIEQLRQVTGESASDYKMRVNVLIQRAFSGDWSNSFWPRLEAANQAEHGKVRKEVVAGLIYSSKYPTV